MGRAIGRWYRPYFAINGSGEVNLLPASPEHRSKRMKLPPARLIQMYRRYHYPIVLLPSRLA